jgi:hypothetical protein
VHAVVNNAGVLAPVSRSALADVTPAVTYTVQLAGALLVVLVVLAWDGPDLGREVGPGDAAAPETGDSSSGPSGEGTGDASETVRA